MANQDSSNTIELSLIRNAPSNPRYELTEIEELAQSMDKYGLIQAIVVKPVEKADDGAEYEIIAGHRRIAAAAHLGWQDIPAIVRYNNVYDESDVQEMRIIENIQREGLTPVDLAQAVGQLLKVKKRGGQAKLAKSVGRSSAWVSKLATIAKALPDPVPDNLRAMTDIDKLYAWATKPTPTEPTEEETADAKTKADKLAEIQAKIQNDLQFAGVTVKYGKDGELAVTFKFADEEEAIAVLMLKSPEEEASEEEQGSLI